MSIPVLPLEPLEAAADDDYLVIIARWDKETDRQITIQDFVQNGESFIPVFSDEAHFDAETMGSGYESEGVLIKRSLLKEILEGRELLILNPGSDAIRLRKGDL